MPVPEIRAEASAVRIGDLLDIPTAEADHLARVLPPAARLARLRAALGPAAETSPFRPTDPRGRYVLKRAGLRIDCHANMVVVAHTLCLTPDEAESLAQPLADAAREGRRLARQSASDRQRLRAEARPCTVPVCPLS